MSGRDTTRNASFTVRNLDSFSPADHPLRSIRAILDVAFKDMDATAKNN